MAFIPHNILYNVKLPRGIKGFSLYTAILFLMISLLPVIALDSTLKFFLAGIGFLALWRYSWMLTHFIRSLIYRHHVFPRWRRYVNHYEADLMPSKVYILMTVFRIDTSTATKAIHASIREAIELRIPTVIVASVVEVHDEFLFKTIFNSFNPPDFIELKIVRIPGVGKRVGLAQGFKAISRDVPPGDAVVVVMDGDTAFLPGALRKSITFFKFMPNLGALTTDELSEVHGTALMRDWHDMRFAQRQILMSSISLSKRVMTLTGRMSIFRADIVTHPDFIHHITNDYLDHYRLGKFRFLTGDDKSSLYWVMRAGYRQIYLPDTQVLTYEDPPSENFIKASTMLMFRWFGNMLRTNQRIVHLGPNRMPFFVWWAFVDQRLSMWTTLAGPTFAVMLTIKYGAPFAMYYIVWIGFTRWVASLMLFSARTQMISWRYPFLLYYNQVYGALLKSWILFRLDVQSWTRQKTKLARGLSRKEYLWNTWISHAVHVSALVIFICLIGFVSEVFRMPYGAVRAVSSLNIHSVAH